MNSHQLRKSHTEHADHAHDAAHDGHHDEHDHKHGDHPGESAPPSRHTHGESHEHGSAGRHHK